MVLYRKLFDLSFSLLVIIIVSPIFYQLPLFSNSNYSKFYKFFFEYHIIFPNISTDRLYKRVSIGQSHVQNRLPLLVVKYGTNKFYSVCTTRLICGVGSSGDTYQMFIQNILSLICEWQLLLLSNNNFTKFLRFFCQSPLPPPRLIHRWRDGITEFCSEGGLFLTECASWQWRVELRDFEHVSFLN